MEGWDYLDRLLDLKLKQSRSNLSRSSKPKAFPIRWRVKKFVSGKKGHIQKGKTKPMNRSGLSKSNAWAIPAILHWLFFWQKILEIPDYMYIYRDFQKWCQKKLYVGHVGTFLVFVVDYVVILKWP